MDIFQALYFLHSQLVGSAAVKCTSALYRLVGRQKLFIDIVIEEGHYLFEEVCLEERHNLFKLFATQQ